MSAALAFAGCDDGSSKPGGEPDPQDMGTIAPTPDAAPIPVVVELAIDTPAERVVVNTETIEVTGTVSPSVPVTLNGVAATVDGGRFSGQVVLSPGENLITAAAGEATATVTVIQDIERPRIDITTPPRGTYVEGQQQDLNFTITENFALDTVTRNGLNVDASFAPDFSLEGIPLQTGLNIFDLTAADLAGNTAQEHVSVLHGELADPSEPLQDAIRFQIGQAALDAIAAIAVQTLDGQDLVALIPPDAIGLEEIEITTITYEQPAQMSLDAEVDRIRFDMRLDRFQLTIGLSIGGRAPYPISIAANTINISGYIVPDIVDGTIVTGIEDFDVQFIGLDFELGDSPPFAEPGEGESLIEGVTAQAIELLVNDQLPALIDGLLSSLDTPIDLELLGAQLQLALMPSAIIISEAGLAVKVSVQVNLLNPVAGEPTVPGYLATRSGWSGLPQTENIGIAVDDDLFNLFLYQLWRAGVLLPRIDQAFINGSGQALSLVTTFLGNVVAKLYEDIDRDTPIAVDVKLPLPIAVTTRKSNGKVGLTMGIGDMTLDVVTDDPAERALLAGAASLIFDGDLSVAANEDGQLALDIVFTDTVALFDVTTPSLRGGDVESSVEEPINELLGSLGGLIPGLLRGFPIPALPLLTLEDLRLDTVGQGDDQFVTIFATVAP